MKIYGNVKFRMKPAPKIWKKSYQGFGTRKK